jgi:putative inorganic carbon (hco3(-)) transporter
VTSLGDLFEVARAELPAPSWAHWASVLFSLSVLSFLISLAAAQAFLAAASAFYLMAVLRRRPAADRKARSALDHPCDRTRVSFPPVKFPLALFCLFTLISIAWAENPTVGWFAVRKLTLFVILLLGVNLVVSGRHLLVLFQGLFVESAVAGLISVPQFFTLYRRARILHPKQVYLYMTVERVRGFMGHWMNFGGQQMLIFAALLAFLLLARTRDSGFGTRGSGHDAASAPRFLEARNPNPESRLFWWPLLAIVILSLLLNFSRGVWLGCFVAAAYLVGCSRPRWLWALPLLMLVGLLLSPRLIRQRVRSLSQPWLDPSVSIRLEMWQVGLRMIRKHPWVGVGPNNIPEVYTLYLPTGKAPEVGYREHLHNDFIQFGAERGLPCLAAWMWLMAALGWHFRRLRRKLKHCGWVADAATAAWLAILVEGCFEFNFGASPVLMLFLFIVTTPFAAEKVENRQLGIESQSSTEEG